MAGEILEEDVVNCPKEGCVHFEVPYTESELHQMRSLVDRSLECSQEIIIECLGAPLKVSLLQLPTPNHKYNCHFQGVNHKKVGNKKSRS